MVERRIPNPMVGGSNPSCPAKFEVLYENFNLVFKNVKVRARKGDFPA